MPARWSGIHSPRCNPPHLSGVRVIVRQSTPPTQSGGGAVLGLALVLRLIAPIAQTSVSARAIIACKARHAAAHGIIYSGCPCRPTRVLPPLWGRAGLAPHYWNIMGDYALFVVTVAHRGIIAHYVTFAHLLRGRPLSKLARCVRHAGHAMGRPLPRPIPVPTTSCRSGTRGAHATSPHPCPGGWALRSPATSPGWTCFVVRRWFVSFSSISGA